MGEQMVNVPVSLLKRIDDTIVNLLNEGREFSKLRTQVLQYIQPIKKYAIKCDQGDVNRNAVLKVVHSFGYEVEHSEDWISCVGFNTIYFNGNKWANWTDKHCTDLGYELVNGKDFLLNPLLYLQPLPLTPPTL